MIRKVRPGRGRILAQALLLAAAAAVAGACASASAAGKPADSPGLNVPVPPPRVIEPGPEPPPEPVSELPAAPNAAPPATRPNRSREARPPTVEAKPNEAKPVEPPAPEPAPAPVPQPPSQPPAQLSTPQTANSGSAAKTVRATLDRANALLNGVNYGPLSNERKKAYDDAKRFIQQAEEALKQGNFVFAQGVATKAETLARELSGR